MPDRRSDLVDLFVRDIDQIELPPRGQWRPTPRKESYLMKTSRSLMYAAAVAAVLVAALLVGMNLRDRGQVATTPSPSPATSTPIATSTSSPSPSPSAVAPGATRFVNAQVGYSLELEPPWRRSDCFSSAGGSGADASSYDTFLTVAAYDEQSGHVGIQHDTVTVIWRPNPERLTPRQWYERFPTAGAGAELTDSTFAGQPAVRIVGAGGTLIGSSDEGWLVPRDTHMLELMSAPRQGGTTPAQRDALISTFRFLSAEELAAARAVPTPSPAPARSAEQVAEVLERAFESKDVALLMTVARPSCLQEGLAEGGASLLSTARFLDQLEARFAKGLTVEVDPASLSLAQYHQDGTLAVTSTWREPGQPDLRVELLVSPERADRWTWAELLYYPGRP